MHKSYFTICKISLHYVKNIQNDKNNDFKRREKHLDNYLQQNLYIYKLIYMLYKKYMEISMKDNTKMKKVT